MIVNGHKLIFIHIPKCGGSSLNDALKDYRTELFNKKIGHATYLDYKQRVGDNIKNYKIFTIVRNPWEWHVSFFFYLKQTNPKHSGHRLEYDLFRTRNFSFTDYIYWLDDDKRPKSKQRFVLRNQFDWCVNEKNEFVVDHVLRLDNIEEDYKEFCEIYDIKENKFPFVNKGSHSLYRNYYDDKTENIIKNKHKKDIEFFKWEF